MNDKVGSVFIEGEVNEKIVERYKSNRLFSVAENKKLNVSAFQLEKNQEDQLKQSAINQTVDFYNRFDSYFLDFRESIGLNVWFLEHFRINFKFIERLKNEALKKAFLEAYPEGKIVQSIPKVSKVSTVIRALREIFYIVLNSLKKSKELNGNVLFHNEGGTNFSVHELYGKLNNHFPVFKMRSLFDLKRSLPARSKLADFPNSDALFLNIILSLKTWFKVKAFRNEFDTLIQSIENETLSLFEQELVSHLKGKVTFFTLMYLRYLSFQTYFETSKIASIILSDENSPQQKVIQYAATKTGVKVFAIQHGAIYNNHFGYTYGKYTHPPILPNVTFTWGEYYNEVLVKYGGYCVEQIKAVGSLRKKSIPKKLKHHSEVTCTKVLFATQPMPNETLRKQYLKDVFLCFSELEIGHGYQLIIRPHPNEKDDQYFENVANEVRFKDFAIERNVKIEEHFDSSDILITAYSTVGAEYVEYYKPIIVLDYLKEDIAGYIEEGIGIPVYNRNGLSEIFESSKIDIDRDAYDKFINRFFHSTDGKTVDRILNVLSKE